NHVFNENYDSIPYKSNTATSTPALDAQQKVNFCNKTEDIDLSHRFSFFSSNAEKTIHVSEIGDILLEGETFQDIFGPDRGTWWLDCLNPTDSEMKMLQKVFSIHPLTAEDIRVQETREKVELFRSYYFVCFRSFEQNAQSEDYLEPQMFDDEFDSFVIILFRLLYGKADVIKMFAKRCTENYNIAPKSEIGLYLGDIQDHLITMTQNLIQFEKILSRSHSNYLAQLSISYVQSNDRSSAMFSKITVIGTIFLPANIITGLFGMNVAVPGEHKPGWFWGIFWCILGYIILVLLIARHVKLI
ncbi:hypothetical protein PCK2_000018, partial [Pneumocystis canis]